MLVAFTASSLLSRLYYANGGKSKWIISWAAVAGWPITALVLLPPYLLGRVSPTPLSLQLFVWYVLLGFLSAADNLMFAWAYAYLPASTASLLSSSSLIFSALFGHFIVKNDLNLSSINAIVIITAGTVIIALDSESDRYPGITGKQYTLGFIWDILGSALHGLIFALSELVFLKLLGRRSFHVVLEQQVMVSLLAFVFTSIGLVVNNDFQGMRSEASNFKHGEGSYAMVLTWAAITFQLGVLAGTAIVFLASTVLAGVLNATTVYSAKSPYWISLTKHEEPHPQHCAYPAVKSLHHKRATKRVKEPPRSMAAVDTRELEPRHSKEQRARERERRPIELLRKGDACGSSTSPRSPLYEIVSLHHPNPQKNRKGHGKRKGQSASEKPSDKKRATERCDLS
ncbi:hypothetical protein BHM03_00045391 [Ensete ventricosum]|nr:hypothetical protein BHM03_00045391 [Ensete ventricosum]